ncbi:MAG: pectate lyase [Planctomycetota bacterium]|nr:pectate lyase [Planctomycetota bacterium]
MNILCYSTLLVLLALQASGSSQDKPKFYKGRQVAQTMHYMGAPWLVRESRQRQEDCTTLLRVLDVKPGQVVCDMGCGNGFYALPMAEKVGPKGKVIAVDIQKQMLSLLKLRAEKEGLGDRIELVLGTVSDPRLPANSVDLILLVDVYHEFSHPEEMLAAMRRSLRPGGRIALVEFRTEDPNVPIKRLHKMSKRQMLRELVSNGFRLVDQFDGLPWQHVMFFERQRADADKLDVAVRNGLGRATDFLRSIAVHGGYAGIYSLDLKQRYGEALYEKATPDEIWIQPPGTPSVAEVMLRAFRLTGEDRYFRGAWDAGLALAWGQRESGGWDHRANLSALDTSALYPERGRGRGTLDDNISQGALTSLIELDDVMEARWLTAAIRLGLDFVLDSQFENGAWPQWYPLRGGYHDYYTFNDNTINDCIRVAHLAHARYGREDCVVAALAGGDFVLASQLPAPQGGWAQQYSHDLRPAKARSFEPAGVCSAVTARNLRTLLDLHLATGQPRFLRAFAAADKWLTRSQLPGGQWARFYELKTNKPIYGDRDGRVHYDLAEISEERRNGYSWQSSYGIEAVRRDYRLLSKLGAAGYRARLVPTESLAELRPVVKKLLAELDSKGRWLRDGRIHVGDYVRNARLLCDFLAVPRH